MAKIILTGDGQEIPVEDEIAKDDELLRSVVKSISPAYSNPTFRRETKAGGELVVHVSKQAGTKGAGAVEFLLAADASPGPVVLMRGRMDRLSKRRRLSVNAALSMEAEVSDAVAHASNDRRLVLRAVSVLYSCEGVPSRYVPEGF
jgi:hypothetical protein